MNRLVEFGGIDKVCCTEFLGPGFFAVVGVDGDDLAGTIGDAALNDAETDAAGSKDGASRAPFDFGGSGGGTEAGGDTTSEETGLVEGSLGIDSDNRDVGDD